MINIYPLRPPQIVIHDLVYLFKEIIFRKGRSNEKILQNRNKSGYFLYTRSLMHFCNLFKDVGFTVSDRETFLNPNGSFNILKFEYK